jgi:hypothetical protein
MQSRQLSLHISALGPKEYLAYTSALTELSGSSDWERQNVSVWEAKGWIRGRFGLSAAVLDQVFHCLAFGSDWDTDVRSV